MILLARTSFAFLICLSLGVALSVIVSNFTRLAVTIPAVELSQSGEIQEITMEVVHDWCGGEGCPDYKIIFQRQGREEYYSSVTKFGRKSHKVQHGDIYKADFDQLARVLESQSFFDLEAVYPKDAACFDCVITAVTVLRDGQRKKVIHLVDDMPAQLWTIHRVLEGMETRVQWLKN